MSNYFIQEIQNISNQNQETEPIEVTCSNTHDDKNAWTMIPHGGFFHPPMKQWEIPKTGSGLEVLIKVNHHEYAFELRGSSYQDLPYLQVRSQSECWFSVNPIDQKDGLKVIVSLPDGIEGILVIGTVDIGDQ